MMASDKAFISTLGGFLERYLAHKRMLGCRSATVEQRIRHFDTFVFQTKNPPTWLSKELVKAYIAYRPGEKPGTQYQRVSTARDFGKFLVLMGEDAYVLPGKIGCADIHGFKPYIFNLDEIARLMAATDKIPYCTFAPMRCKVMPVVLRLIYGCGLRVSEARTLTVADVDLQDGVLHIRSAKFYKDRYVPIAANLLERCRDFAETSLEYSGPSAPFFPSPSRGFYSRSAISVAFRMSLQAAGIPHTDSGPTVHSLRHSFAVHRLMKWGQGPGDINALLPYLSAYMGHKDLLGTQRYLRMTVEMFPDIRARMASECAWIVPEVTGHGQNNR